MGLWRRMKLYLPNIKDYILLFLKSFRSFVNFEQPKFGPVIDIDFDKILYYKDSKLYISNHFYIHNIEEYEQTIDDILNKFTQLNLSENDD